MKEKHLLESNEFVHQEHQQWLSQLNFYQDEIKFFQNELALVLHRNMDSLSIIEYVEEYKEILLKKLEHIDELRHDIISHEKKLKKDTNGDLGEPQPHEMVREKFDTFVQDFELMKKNFKRFAAHND
jgi:hypothetical protein